MLLYLWGVRKGVVIPEIEIVILLENGFKGASFNWSVGFDSVYTFREIVCTAAFPRKPGGSCIFILTQPQKSQSI